MMKIPKLDRLTELAKEGDAESVRRILSRKDDPRPIYPPKIKEALVGASMNGQVECVRLLLSVSAPGADYSLALRTAADRGYAECVRLLLPFSDPRSENSASLRWSAINGYSECVRILLPVSDVDEARRRLVAADKTEALMFLDAVMEETSLKSKHLKPDNERVSSGL